ncbi:recombinase family protein [Klebsiella pneumoniae]|uniref:recombinase family protein n=1 Tax=Klebsiella pneumoniae TaxID=573 RepID=UPI00388D53A9
MSIKVYVFSMPLDPRKMSINLPKSVFMDYSLNLMMFKDLPEVLRAICLHQVSSPIRIRPVRKRHCQRRVFSLIKFVLSMPARRTQTARGYREPGQLRPGDTLLVHSIDRLCRNMSDMCAVTTRLRDQGYPYFSERAADVQRRHKQLMQETAAAHDVGIQPV